MATAKQAAGDKNLEIYGAAGERTPVELERTELDESGQWASLRYRVRR